MIAVSLMIEGQQGVTWTHWKRLVSQAEGLGFAGLFRSDHFTDPQPPGRDALEALVSLTYTADRTRRIHFGTLVAPISLHDPVYLARQAMAIDDLSGGRFILGLGAGWQEREHHLFGYALGDVSTRMARFEEGLEVISRLLRSDEPVTYEGRFYQLHGATLLPRPQRAGGPSIMIGGNGVKRTLPLVARYANIWNGVFLSPEAFGERSRLLDRLLRDAGRQSTDVQRTAMTGIFFGRSQEELNQKLNWRLSQPDLHNLALDEVIEKLAADGRGVAGTLDKPDKLVEQIHMYERAGAEEIMLQWLDYEDVDGIAAFAQNVLPRL